jgi:uncharacterized protein YdaU (DUF1376 family)
MHYYKRNIGDYHKKAGRLSLLQHGVYSILMDAIYDREKFPTKQEAIGWCWASTPEEVSAVELILSKFFTNGNGVYKQKRIEEELNAFTSRSVTNKRIAIERETNRANKSTKREPVVHESPPNHKPLTINHKEEGDKPPRATVNKFKKPTAKEVSDYCQEIQSPISPQGFIDFYDSNGWKVGKNSMKSWEAAVRTWTQREKKNGKAQTTGKPSENQIERMAKTLNITPKPGENYDSLYRRCLSQGRE